MHTILCKQCQCILVLKFCGVLQSLTHASVIHKTFHSENLSKAMWLPGVTKVPTTLVFIAAMLAKVAPALAVMVVLVTVKIFYLASLGDHINYLTYCTGH